MFWRIQLGKNRISSYPDILHMSQQMERNGGVERVISGNKCRGFNNIKNLIYAFISILMQMGMYMSNQLFILVA